VVMITYHEFSDILARRYGDVAAAAMVSMLWMWEDAGCGSGTDRRMRPAAAPFSSFSFSPFFLSFPLAGPQAGPRPANGEILVG